MHEEKTKREEGTVGAETREARPRVKGASAGGNATRRNHAGRRKLERRENTKVKKTVTEKEKPLSPQEAARLTREENIAVGICPFFQQDRGNGRVCCEGATLKFPDKEARRDFVYRLCAHPEGYKECRMRLALEHYYERKYEDHE